MIEAIKQQAAKFMVKKAMKPHSFQERNFTTIFKRSYAFLVLMPLDEKDFWLATAVLHYLKDNKKTVFVVTNDFRVSLLPPSLKSNVIDYGINDQNKLQLPSKKLMSRINDYHFDVLIDMNRTDVLFYNYITNVNTSAIKLGFARPSADKYFNLQVVNNEANPEISYQNLLNCLKMF
jgi:hypothetical protein